MHRDVTSMSTAAVYIFTRKPNFHHPKLSQRSFWGMSYSEWLSCCQPSCQRITVGGGEAGGIWWKCSVSAVLCCRVGSSSAHTVAAGAALAEALRPWPLSTQEAGLRRFLPVAPPPFLGAALLVERCPRLELEHGLCVNEGFGVSSATIYRNKTFKP